MNFNSPLRPKLGNGLPAWLSAPQIALPRLCLSPLETDGSLWQLQVMVNSSWKTLLIPTENLVHTLFLWSLDPEQFIKDQFNVEITPTTSQFNSTPDTDFDPSELGI